MSTYVIGDVQGCYDELLMLLEHILFDPKKDTLWFTGDLVNRGPKSLEVLRFIKGLPGAITVLGNHDLTLLTLAYTDLCVKHHTLEPILAADDREDLLNWLRQQPLIYESKTHQCVLVHAGIPPQWSITKAKLLAKEVEQELKGEHFKDLLKHMFGNEPSRWEDELAGWERYRFIINGLTRLRFCHPQYDIDFEYKGEIKAAPERLVPWFHLRPPKEEEGKRILFGHWAALKGKTEVAHIQALDTGCFWGGTLTALRLEDNQLFAISCPSEKANDI